MHKILIIRPNEEPEIIGVQNQNEIFKIAKSLIGGFIQKYNLSDRIAVLMDEDGKLKKLEPNRMIKIKGIPTGDYYVGTICVVGIENNIFNGLTDEQIDSYSKTFSLKRCGI